MQNAPKHKAVCRHATYTTSQSVLILGQWKLISDTFQILFSFNVSWSAIFVNFFLSSTKELRYDIAVVWVFKASQILQEWRYTWKEEPSCKDFPIYSWYCEKTCNKIPATFLSITHIIHKGLIRMRELVNYSMLLVFLRLTNEMEELTSFPLIREKNIVNFTKIVTFS